MMTGDLPVLLVSSAVVGPAMPNHSLEQAEVPGVNSLSVVLLAGTDVRPAPVDLSQGDAQWVGHEQ